MDSLTKRIKPDRSKINMHQAWELDYWTRELGVSRSELQRVIEKVGNSAAEVRKELARKTKS
jgi:AraC-like DNA-binding protein